MFFEIVGKMKEKIQSILKIIEQKHGMRILYACESGSRAWGFDSKDSDWDIRFVYVRPKEFYLSVFPNEKLHLDHNNSEVCKKFLDYELDFVGWDIKKVLYQFSRGNPDMISWFFSPIVYRANENAHDIFKSAGKGFFKSKAAYYHYIHMARGNYNQYIKNPEGNLVNTKKYLYVLRPLLACMWIEQFNNEPPMFFENIYNNEKIKELLLQNNVYHSIVKLILEKKNGTELDRRPREPSLDSFCETWLDYYANKAQQVQARELTDDDCEFLDNTFRFMLKFF